MIDIVLGASSGPLRKISAFLFTNKIAKIINIVVIILATICSIVLIVYTKTSLNQIESKYYYESILPFFIVPIGIIVFFFLIHIASETSDIYDRQLENLLIERAEITQKLESEKELDIFHTIQLSLNQVNEYYTINKSQARSSFRFSIFAIVIGLLTILIGIWLYYIGNSNIKLGYITGISGTILEFIGAAYFFMYKKSLDQVNFFFGQLIKIQDTMLSINLANNITATTKKTEMQEKIIESLLERNLK